MNDRLRKNNKHFVKIEHPRLAFGICSIFLIAFLRIGLSLNIPIVVFIVLCGVTASILNSEELVSYIISLVAFASVLQYRYSIYLASIILCYKDRRTKVRYKHIILLFVIMLWELLHAHLSQLDLYGFLQDFAEFVALTVVLTKPYRNYSNGLPMRTLAYSTLLSCSLNLIATVKHFGFSTIAFVRLGLVSRIETGDFMGNMNPNITAFLCLLSITGLLLIRQYNREKTSDQVSIIILVVFMLLTQSRSALLCLIIVYLLYAVWGFDKTKAANANRVIGALTVILITSIIVPVFFSNTIYALIDRFNTFDLSNGRIQIFSFYHYHLTRRPMNYLFGIGLHNYNSTITNMYGSLWQSYKGLARYNNGQIIYKVCHCNFQEILVAWGLPGLLFIYILLRNIIQHNVNKVEKVNEVVLIIILIFTLQFQFLTSGPVIVGLLFSLTCIEYNPEQCDCI